MNSVVIIAEIGRIQESDITTKNGESMKIARFSMNPKRAENKAHDFPRIRMIGKMAENFLKFHKEGDKAMIKGAIETSSYEKDGETIYTTEVFATGWEFVDKDAADMNSVMLTGNLVRDPFEPSAKVKSFTIGVTRDRDSEKSDFPRIVRFGESPLDIKKGNKVLVVGRIQTGSFEKDGKKYYTTDIAVTDAGTVSVLQAGNGGNGNTDGGTGANTAPAQVQAQQDSWAALEEDVPF